ncbi:MAG: delta-aminolevulinic acid dehydratase [Bacteroidota bacterium]
MRVEDSLKRLENYVLRENYKGYDPYDALNSPLFNLPFFNSNKLVRFVAQQIVKRSPLNLRPLLKVPKERNPVSLGLILQGYAFLSDIIPDKKKEYYQKINMLTSDLINLIPEGYSGSCWGYNFDWEARYANIPAYQPTVVATGIVANALYHAWKITGLNKLKDLLISSSKFVLNDLNRTYDGNLFLFSYSPFDKQRVFNASMKGARLLSQVHSITGDETKKVTAKRTVEFVINNQKTDGSWEYSLAKSGGWIDNYHSGYILDCLDDYIKLCEDDTYIINLRKGFKYYKNNFFGSDGRPSFYSDKVYPIDCTAASQSILTLTRFGELKLAEKVAKWMIDNMQGDDGSFYFRKFKLYTNRTSFMRWSNAWMFVALTYFLNKKSNEEKG